MRGRKYLINGHACAVYYHPRSSIWFAEYQEQGKTRRKHLGKDDPRECYPLIPLARKPGTRRYVIGVYGATYNTLIAIMEQTGEDMTALQARLAKQELERLRREESAGSTPPG